VTSGVANTSSDPTTDEPPGTRGPITAATKRLLVTAENLDAESLASPSLCEGWTRAHVLAHVARNAESLVNLLTWARTGTPTYQYQSAESRQAGIQAGAHRDLGDLIDDIIVTSERFSHAVNEMPDEAWAQLVSVGPDGAGDAVPARRVLWMRLLEVEIHHVDLDAGYEPTQWPRSFTTRALTETMHDFGRRPGTPAFAISTGSVRERVGDGGRRMINGSPGSVLSWLVGRSDGTELTVDPAGPLPDLPAWK
jgi:maleylpyruvate isomerase